MIKILPYKKSLIESLVLTQQGFENYCVIKL